MTDDAFFIKNAASSAFPLLTGFLFLFLSDVEFVPPNPPRITLKNERFIPLHMM